MSGAPPGLLRVALAQLDLVVGDIGGNAERLRESIAAAREQGAQLVLLPELAITGYPPEDLLLREGFLRDARAALDDVARDAVGIVALAGFPERAEDVYNALAVMADGQVRAVYRKTYLPNYGVFDEHRYFQTGSGGAVIDVGGLRVGLTVCEDMWEPGPPASDEAVAGAHVIVNPSASPYHHGKGVERERMFIQRARDNAAAVLFCNLVGGQDELVFDGHSLVVDHEGEIVARAGQFREELLIATIDPSAAGAVRLRDAGYRAAARRSRVQVPVLAELELPEPVEEPSEVGGPVADVLDTWSELYAALQLGLRDYVEKNGFGKVVLGLSGGIDSALVALLAADALGPDRVVVAIMPSPYSSSGTQDDARVLARNLGVETYEFSIMPAMEAYERMLADAFEGRQADLTEENIQARIRGNLLMALSNKFGWLVLTTGNKSETSVGYSTLYGDLAGGLAVIKDVPKTDVYELVRHRDRIADGPLVPETIVTRPPSAELREDQKDEDSLPPYEILDPIIEAYVEHDQDIDQIVRRGFDPEVVERVIRMIDRAEYKRRQAPPGIRVTSRAFGRDRRMPITNRYTGRPVSAPEDSPAAGR
jgi:NAD+ synthase (glutamine-hydrolysing)